MDFVAIDVETANPNMDSICQIGVAKYVSGKLIEEWSELIDPDDYFDIRNVGIHGIDEEDVSGYPKFPEVADRLGEFLNNTICVSYGPFDPLSINRALAKHELQEIDTTWLNTMTVVRRTWPEFSKRGYSLPNVCDKLGYKFKHHDALEDAKACAYVLLAAVDKSGVDVESWLDRVKPSVSPKKRTKQAQIKREGDPAGEMYGEVMVMTGELKIWSNKAEAAELAASIGCDVDERITKRTTLLVVGDRDVLRFGGKKKSGKHIKAEQLIEKGQDIKILKESDFNELIKGIQN